MMMMMLDPANDLLPPPSSPTNSSFSSSDLDTESTGSFFPDRSTTLGTLMGVTFPAVTFRAPSQHRQPSTAAATAAGVNVRRNSRRARNISRVAPAEERRRWRSRRRWWGLCGEEEDCRRESKPSSLGQFLEEERRFGSEDRTFYGAAAAEIEGVVGVESQQRNGRLLFADGRVLPPAEVVEEVTSTGDDGGEVGGGICRFPVAFIWICNGSSV